MAIAIVPLSYASNIVTFDNNGTTCGGAVICSTNGTLGYLNNVSGTAFDLSTINSWFQIDVNGVNYLGTQTSAEPDGGAGGFRVLNDTGHAVTSFSLTLSDTFTSSTPSVTFCSGNSGPLCDNFQAAKGAAAPSGAGEALSGLNFYNCTNGGAGNGYPCYSSAGQAAANFEPGTVTLTWTGLNIAPGAIFDISFSSWNNSSYNTPPVPEPSSLVLLGSGLIGMGTLVRRKLRR